MKQDEFDDEILGTVNETTTEPTKDLMDQIDCPDECMSVLIRNNVFRSIAVDVWDAITERI